MVKKVPDELSCCGINGRKTNSRWQCIRLNRSPGSAHWQCRGKPRADWRFNSSVRHVQRMLKLTELVPEILAALAKDEITTEHCQALALESDQKRQVEVLESARKRSLNNEVSVSSIRNLITSQKRFPTNGDKFRFVERSFSPMKSGLISSAAKMAAMSKVHRPIPPCWKTAEHRGSTPRSGRLVMV